MHPHLAKNVFHELFKDSDGYELSTIAKQRLGLADSSLTYGEITWDSFLDIMAEVHYLGGHDTFYDLGSGNGKAVIAAAMLGTFKRVFGVELLEELYKESKRILLTFNKRVRPMLSPHRQDTLIDFIHNDVFKYDWSDGGVLFCQTTCFGDALMHQLEEQLLALKKGSIIITLSKSLLAPDFAVLQSRKYPTSWGTATVFIHKKIR